VSVLGGIGRAKSRYEEMRRWGDGEMGRWGGEQDWDARCETHKDSVKSYIKKKKERNKNKS